MGLALAGVAQNQHIGVSFVIGAPVKVREDVGAKLVPSQVEAVGVGLATVIEGIEIGNRRSGQHPLVLGAKMIVPKGQDREKALQLAECQPVHVDLAPGQLHHHVGLQLPQPFRVGGFQLDEHGAVKERLPVFPQLRQQLHHVLEVVLGLHRLLHIVPAGAEPVSAGGVLDDLPLLGSVHQPIINA